MYEDDSRTARRAAPRSQARGAARSDDRPGAHRARSPERTRTAAPRRTLRAPRRQLSGRGSRGRRLAPRLGCRSRSGVLGARRVIAVDTNVLVYAHRQDSEWHEPATRAVRQLAEGAAPWAIPWPCVHEFLAIATHPRIFRSPTPL